MKLNFIFMGKSLSVTVAEDATDEQIAAAIVKEIEAEAKKQTEEMQTALTGKGDEITTLKKALDELKAEHAKLREEKESALLSSVKTLLPNLTAEQITVETERIKGLSIEQIETEMKKYSGSKGTEVQPQTDPSGKAVPGILVLNTDAHTSV